MQYGAYSKFRILTNEDKEIFNMALKDLVSISYEPLIVASQVVAGTNYKFVCNATTIYPGASPYLAMITIFVPLSGQGDLAVTEINKID